MAGSEDPWFWSSCSEYANQQDALPAAFAGLARPRPRGPTTSFWDEWRSRSDTGSGLDDEASHPACGCGVSPGVDEMESAAAPNEDEASPLNPETESDLSSRAPVPGIDWSRVREPRGPAEGGAGPFGSLTGLWSAVGERPWSGLHRQRKRGADAILIESCFKTLGNYVGDGSVGRYPRVLTYGMKSGDFDPGFPAGPSLMPPWDGSPEGSRILIAVSEDGKTWTKTGLVAMDNASVPALAVEDDKLFLFCNAHTRSVGLDQLVMAWTEDLMNWRYNVPRQRGLGSIPTSSTGVFIFQAPVWMDPSVVRRVKAGDDGWYLFFTMARNYTPTGERGANTFVAKASSLLDRSWTIVNSGNPVYPYTSLAGFDSSAYGAVPWEVDDPCVVYMERGTGTPYYQYLASPKELSRPVSPGMASLKITFDAADNATVTVMPNLVRYVPSSGSSGSPTEMHFSNGLETHSGEYRWFAFGQGASSSASAEIFSYTLPYRDPAYSRWTLESSSPVLVLDRSYESRGVQDAAVVQFKNCYVMAYNTKIP